LSKQLHTGELHGNGDSRNTTLDLRYRGHSLWYFGGDGDKCYGNTVGMVTKFTVILQDWRQLVWEYCSNLTSSFDSVPHNAKDGTLISI